MDDRHGTPDFKDFDLKTDAEIFSFIGRETDLQMGRTVGRRVKCKALPKSGPKELPAWKTSTFYRCQRGGRFCAAELAGIQPVLSV